MLSQWALFCLFCLWSITSAIAGAYDGDKSLLWLPRPNLYFGLRAQLPESPLFGFMWFSSNHLAGLSKIRYDYNGDDGISAAKWAEYNIRQGGRHVVKDPENGVNLSMELVKSPDGDGWTVRIRGDQSKDNILSFVFNAVFEDPYDVKLESRLTDQGVDGDVLFSGSTPDLGDFNLAVTAGEGEWPVHLHDMAQLAPAGFAGYTSLKLPKESSWRAREIYLTMTQDRVAALSQYFPQGEDVPAWAVYNLNNDASQSGNIHFVQKTFKGPFTFDVVFGSPKSFEKQMKALTSGEFKKTLKDIAKNQKAKFDKALSLQKPFTNLEHYELARELIDNLAGGIGYFYGNSLIAGSEDPTEVKTNAPYGLMCATPSRARFPRGFYWDEGFHLMGLMEYDRQLVLDIVSSWFNTMDEDGWIAREQILGSEARARVPPEFQIQVSNYANPPTFHPLLAMLSTRTDLDAPSVAKLKQLYPKLRQHFDWFSHTQRGELEMYDRSAPSRDVYRWRGRSQTHVLTSGLDDYPRAGEPSDGELHVDLLSWVGAMAAALSDIAKRVGETQDAEKFAQVYRGIQMNLNALHWSEEHGAYCDVTVDEFEEDAKVCHIGYVTILPFALKLVDASDERRVLLFLKQLRDPDMLWSDYGIRSLSKSDEFFAKDENYWRGPVWVNMNYLVLTALQHYATSRSASSAVRSEAAAAYGQLRENVVSTVFNEWKRTGYVWEQYDSVGGEARGGKQFTGWTALAANIMAMPEILVAHEEL